MNRLAGLNQHFSMSRILRSKENLIIDGKSYTEVIDYHSNREIKINFFNRQGWGYADSGFEYNKETQQVKIKGHRYMFGGKTLPKFATYISDNLHADFSTNDPAQ